jgi:hypothetical protein
MGFSGFPLRARTIITSFVIRPNNLVIRVRNLIIPAADFVIHII